MMESPVTKTTHRLVEERGLFLVSSINILDSDTKRSTHKTWDGMGWDTYLLTKTHRLVEKTLSWEGFCFGFYLLESDKCFDWGFLS